MIVTSIREALAADRRLTIRDLIERFDMGYGTMHQILTEDLQMSKAMAESSQLMPLINTGNYRGGTNDKPGPTI